VLLHDAFKGLAYWNDFMTGSGYQGVAMDTHIYQMFSQDVRHPAAAAVLGWTDLTRTPVGRIPHERPTHLLRMLQRRRNLRLPPLGDRRRMDGRPN
jgi:hypothetical protein